jgi:tetratricopeptide (TPR) repeat protein
MNTLNYVQKLGFIAWSLLVVTHASSNDTAKIHFDKGNDFQDKKEYVLAIENYSTAIKIDPTWACPHNNIGSCFKKLDRLEEAEAAFTTSIDLVCIHVDKAYANRAEIYLELGKFKKAVEDSDISIALMKKEYPRRYTTRGKAYYNMREFKKAFEDFSQALDTDPDYLPALVMRAKTNFKTYNSKHMFTDILALHVIIETHKQAWFYLHLTIIWIFLPIVIISRWKLPDFYKNLSKSLYSQLVYYRICSPGFADKCIQIENGKAAFLTLICVWLLSASCTFIIFLLPLFI